MLAVTNTEFWKAVGDHLTLIRKARTVPGTSRPLTPHDIKKGGGPDGKTVIAIECGTPGRIERLEKLCEYYGLAVIDVFKAVIDAESGKHPQSPEAMMILRKYKTTTVEGRQALVSTSKALPDDPERLAEDREAPDAPVPTTKASDRSVR